MHQAALGEHDVQLVDALQVGGLREQHQVGVAARAHQREGPQQAVGAEVLAGRDELALVAGALLRVEAPPGGIDLQERVFDELTLSHGCVHSVLEGVSRTGALGQAP